MSLNAENFKIGACALVWKGVMLGGTQDAPAIKIEPSYTESFDAQTFKQALDKTLQQMKITITADVKDIDTAFGLVMDENGKLTAGSLGQRVSADAGELLLIPYNPQDPIGYRLPRAVLMAHTKYVFNDIAEHNIELEFEALPDNTGILMEKFIVEETQRISFDNSLLVPIADVERALTKFVAEKLNLTVDVDIFRGGVPVGVDGCGVQLLRENCTNIPSRRSLHMAVEFKDSSRDTVFQTMHDLASYLPVYGINITLDVDTEVKISALLKDCVDISEISDDGQIKISGIMYIKAII
jgi:hypothetical protein